MLKKKKTNFVFCVPQRESKSVSSSGEGSSCEQKKNKNKSKPKKEQGGAEEDRLEGEEKDVSWGGDANKKNQLKHCIRKTTLHNSNQQQHYKKKKKNLSDIATAEWKTG